MAVTTLHHSKDLDFLQRLGAHPWMIDLRLCLAWYVVPPYILVAYSFRVLITMKEIVPWRCDQHGMVQNTDMAIYHSFTCRCTCLCSIGKFGLVKVMRMLQWNPHCCIIFSLSVNWASSPLFCWTGQVPLNKYIGILLRLMSQWRMQPTATSCLWTDIVSVQSNCHLNQVCTVNNINENTK